MEQWKEVKLGDVAEIISGFAFKSSDLILTDGIPILKITNVKNPYLSYNFINYLPKEKYESKMKKFFLKENDVLIAMTGQGSVGRIGIAKGLRSDILVNQRVGIIRAKEKLSLQLFIAVLLSNPYYEKVLYDLGIGAGQPNISPKLIENLKIPLPPLPIQQRIASILSAYDDLIENNRRRIALLEESARLLYKEWFVKFKFPGHEKAKFVGGLPEGWERKKLGEVGTIITGKTPSTKDERNYGGNILFIKTPDMQNGCYTIDTETKLTIRGAETQKGKYVPKNTILTACIGNGLGVVSMTYKTSQFNQQINAFIPNIDIYTYYYYLTFCNLKPKLKAIGASATMPNVNKSLFESLEIIQPEYKATKTFYDLIAPVFDQIRTLQLQTQKLKGARDILLPKLMKGIIKV